MKKLKKWQKTFWQIYIGQALSLITSAFVQYALIWYITEKTGSAFYLSMAAIVGFLPQGILGLFVGSYIDKHNRKKIMIASDIFIALASLGLAIMSFATTVPIWLIMVVLAIRSIGSAFHGPALQASIPLIVPGDKMLKYQGYSQTMQSLSLIISPALAAVLYASMRFGSVIMFDVLGAIVAVSTLAISAIPSPKLSEEESKVDFIKDSKEGFKIVLNNKLILAIFIMSALFNLVFMPVSALFPLMVQEYFKGTIMHTGLVETMFAAGMLLGSLVLATDKVFKNKRKNLIIAAFIISITLTASGLLPSNFIYVFFGVCLIMGFAGPIFNATISTIFAEEVDPSFLGRIHANYLSVVVLAMPLGLLLSGAFADKIGINIWFLISGIIILIMSFVCIFSKELKLIKEPKIEEEKK